MAIWHQSDIQLKDLQHYDLYMGPHLGLEFTDLGPDFLVGTLPVDERTMQPRGILHGGSSCVLAESLGSVAANLVLDPQKSVAVGLEINANHLRAVRQGKITGKATPLHLGRSTSVWDIKITDDQNKTSAVCRLTMAIIKK